MSASMITPQVLSSQVQSRTPCPRGLPQTNHSPASLQPLHSSLAPSRSFGAPLHTIGTPWHTIGTPCLPSAGREARRAWALAAEGKREGDGAGAGAGAEGVGGGKEEGEQLERIKAGMGERRAVDRSERLQEDPYSPVESTMSSPVVTTRPDALVGSILELFEHFTGLPVVDGSGKCVGIISSSDVFEQQKKASQKSVSNLRVSDVMSSPAVVITQHAPVAYAAGLMLKHKVHRLPVVDNKLVVVGIVTRTDIYEPLLPQVNPLYHHLVGSSLEFGSY